MLPVPNPHFRADVKLVLKGKVYLHVFIVASVPAEPFALLPPEPPEPAVEPRLRISITLLDELVIVTAHCDFSIIHVPLLLGLLKASAPVPVIDIDV